jgi:hypothetical protein
MTWLYLFSLLPIPALAVTVIVMYCRKQHKVYPVFWAYLIFHIIRAAVEVSFYCFSYRLYFYSYWTASACGVIFDLLLLRSIFLTVLDGYSPLYRLRRSGYEVVLLAFCVLALFLAYHNVLTYPPMGRRMIAQLIFHAEQAVSMVAVGMFIFVVGSSAFLGIRWTSELCGIALGVGLLGITDLAVFYALSHGDLLSVTAAGWIETLAYDCAMGIYAFSFVPRQKPARSPAPLNPEWVQWLDRIRGALSE